MSPRRDLPRRGLHAARARCRPSRRSASRQSYTYFTWRNFKQELIDYLTELTQRRDGGVLPGTLLREHARHPAAHPRSRAVRPRSACGSRWRRPCRPSTGSTAGTSSARTPPSRAPRSTWTQRSTRSRRATGTRPATSATYVARINRIRRENRALHEYRNLVFYESDDEHVLCYGKRSSDGANAVLVAVNLDPFAARRDRRCACRSRPWESRRTSPSRPTS